jgi:hypothetical protein
MFIPDLVFYPDPAVKKAPYPGSATLHQSINHTEAETIQTLHFKKMKE